MTLDKDDLRRHLSGQFNKDLDVLVDDVRTMGQLVSTQLRDALRALERNDAAFARQVVARDAEVNQLELRLDEECRDVLVRRQPAAGDLRLVFAVIKVVMDLERMGDLAKRVAKAVAESSGLPQERFGAAIVALGGSVLALTEKALAAFASFDGTAAAAVKVDDRAIDERCKALTAELQSFIREHPETTVGSVQLIWAARALERYGDHAKNIAEYVFYAVYGKEVRHMNDAERARWLPAG
jgi:phosphate transport system protein